MKSLIVRSDILLFLFLFSLLSSLLIVGRISGQDLKGLDGPSSSSFLTRRESEYRHLKKKRNVEERRTDHSGRLDLRKCCSFSEIYLNSEMQCVDTKTDRFESSLKKLNLPQQNNRSSLSYSDFDESSKPCECMVNHHDPSDANSSWWLSVNDHGRLLYGTGDGRRRLIVERDSYCLEFVVERDMIEPFFCCAASDDESTINLTILKKQNAWSILYTISLALSTVFLLGAFLLLVFTEKIKDLPGKCHMCQLATMMIGYVAIIPDHIFLLSDINRTLCLTSAFVAQFCLISGFFWLNVICYDIWTSFRNKRPSAVSQSSKTFVRYSICAWGCPAIITSITLLAQFWDGKPEILPKSYIGNTKCWFEDQLSGGVYFCIPIGLLLALDVVMFCDVIYKYNKSWNIVRNRSDSTRFSERHYSRYSACLKLFIVMGTASIAEVISWYCKSSETGQEDEEGSKYVWRIFDVCNVFQGVGIFYVIISCRKTREFLAEKFRRKHKQLDIYLEGSL